MLTNRRLLIAIGAVLFLAIIIIVWYFFYAKPAIAPSLTGTNNPLPVDRPTPRFQFLTLWGTTESTSTSETEVTNPLENPLVEVWKKPATGQTFIVEQVLKEVTSTTTLGTTTVEEKRLVRATTTRLLFVDKTTGYVYRYSLSKGTPYQISNSVFPGIHDAYFFEEGKRVLMRYIDQEKNTVVTFIANLPKVQEGDSPLPLEKIQYISGDVSSVALTLKKDKISYIVTGTNGSSVYTITPKGPSLVTTSPFREWNLSYGGNTLYVTTKPSAYIEGATLSLPSFQVEIAEKTGLVSNPGPSGMLINSMWSSGGLATFLSLDGNIKVLSVATIASKCSWGDASFLICAVPRLATGPEEGLPDDWYQGRTRFEDDLYTINPKNGVSYPLYAFTEGEGIFDIENLSISPDNSLISFNKRQGASLWVLNTELLHSD